MRCDDLWCGRWPVAGNNRRRPADLFHSLNKHQTSIYCITLNKRLGPRAHGPDRFFIFLPNRFLPILFSPVKSIFHLEKHDYMIGVTCSQHFAAILYHHGSGINLNFMILQYIRIKKGTTIRIFSYWHRRPQIQARSQGGEGRRLPVANFPGQPVK